MGWARLNCGPFLIIGHGFEIGFGDWELGKQRPYYYKLGWAFVGVLLVSALGPLGFEYQNIVYFHLVVYVKRLTLK